jgi:hypothetical protein
VCDVFCMPALSSPGVADKWRDEVYGLWKTVESRHLTILIRDRRGGDAEPKISISRGHPEILRCAANTER